jgi:tRNA dimethylallyltransferase
VVDPDELFDAARYAELAHPAIRLIHERGRVPLVVGGTGLYMKVLTRGICEGPAVDPRVRLQLREEESDRGLAILHAELSVVDPALGESLHPNDRQRILRGLEVFRSTGKRLSDWQAEHRFEQRLYPTVKIFLCRSREDLYERINRRVIEMMGLGFLAEVEQLLARGYGPELKSMQSLGYKHMAQHLLANVPLEAAFEQMKRDTRRYAKRQMTWFRGDPEFRWMNADDLQAVIRWVEERIEAISSHK